MKITIFNVGRGSAVLIELPPTKERPAPVGIVDCFSGVTQEEPLLKRFAVIDREAAGQASIEFFVLTHFHGDHFLGAERFLKQYGSKIIKYFDPGIDPRLVMSADFRTSRPYDKRHQSDLLELTKFKEKNPSRVYSLTSPGMAIYSDAVNDVTISSIAPDGLMLNGVRQTLQRYLAKARAALKKEESIPDPDRSYDLNRTSSALDVRCKDTRLILGGDVLTRTWNIVLANMQIESDIILLSHHGAANAFPKKIWDRLHKRYGHSIVSGKGNGQPDRNVLKHLREHAQSLWATNVPHGSGSDPTLTYVHMVHLGGERNAPVSNQGNVICEVSSELKISGPRIF